MLGDERHRFDHAFGTTASAGRRSAEILYLPRRLSHGWPNVRKVGGNCQCANQAMLIAPSPDAEGFHNSDSALNESDDLRAKRRSRIEGHAACCQK